MQWQTHGVTIFPINRHDMNTTSKITISAVSVLALSAFLITGYLLSRSLGSDLSRIAAGESPYERRRK